MSDVHERLRMATALWDSIRGINGDSVDRIPAATRAIADGATRDDLVTAMRAAAYEAIFGTLSYLTAEESIDELARSGVVHSLHEDLLSADPSGLEGTDLFA